MTELVFVVDDEVRACRLARHCLEGAGHAVRTFSTAAEIEGTQGRWPSLILIAATLPDGSGLRLCRQIRQNPAQASTPIIVLTAGTSEEQTCAALEAGADNYLAKPFSPSGLMARVQSALQRKVRRFPGRTADAEIVIDHGAQQLSIQGSEVVTTTLEFRLVDYLARHRGHVFSRDMLLDAVWGEAQFVTPRSVDACIRRVRAKIEPDSTRPTYIKTVRGIGYRFDAVAVWPTSSESCNCVACAPSNARTVHTGALIEKSRILSPRKLPRIAN